MADSPFATKVVNDETIIIDAGHRLDNNNAHEMADVISLAQANNYKNIVLDMHQLQFISSAGVGSILGTIEISREKGGDIILCNASESIMNVLEVLDLADYLTIKPDLADIPQVSGIEG